ncbi:minor tail protein [Streptomyces phage phiBT1]|uniref:Gp46 n=1 Tax=Lomovskayavirus BT1 TaxID=225588 RepID=Q859B2_9CAUD|nr:minor tail protein [Streptomyces phage phiBT1]CAD80113.1 gp46 [Lomovskayavirus BT1]
MTDYEVLQVEAKTGNVIATLPVTDIKYGETLNAAGTATVGMPLDAADPDTLAPGRSALVVCRDGEPDWGGMLWTAAADLAQGTLTLNASGWHSYYAGRVLHDGYERKSDQALLLRDWYEMCNEDGGIGTDTSRLTTSGRVVSRLWTQYELKVVADAISELAEERSGFNFRYETYWRSATQLGNRLLMYPMNSAATPFALTHRLNCDVTQVSYDAAAMATRAYAVGADNGNGTKLVGIADNALDMPTKHLVQSFSDVKSTETLISKAYAIAAAGAAPVAIPTLTLYPGAFKPSDFVPGAVGAVQVDSGYVRVLDDFVITERSTSIDANGTELTNVVSGQ